MSPSPDDNTPPRTVASKSETRDPETEVPINDATLTIAEANATIATAARPDLTSRME